MSSQAASLNFDLEKFVRASVTASFLHVSDLLKSTQQKHPDQKIVQIVKTALFEHRHGIFTGWQTNFFRRMSKDIAKWTIVQASQESIVDRFPHVFEKNSLSTNLLTAAIVACFDTAVLYPVDLLNANRIKRSAEKMNYFQFASRFYLKHGIRGFYHGARADLSRQMLGWSTFLVVDGLVKRQFDRKFPDNSSPMLRQFVAANAIAGSYILLAQPFDAAKFQRQINPSLQSGIIKTLGDIFQTKGLRGLYSGAAFVYCSIVGRSLVWGGYKDRVMHTGKTDH